MTSPRAETGRKSATPTANKGASYKRLHTTVNRWMKIADWEAVDIILAASLCLYLPGDPVWLMVIKPPSGGGTEILRAIADHHDSQQLDDITPSTLSSGLKLGEGKHGGEKMLEKLNGKRLITLDISRYLGHRSETRREIFSQLRGAYDGSVATAFGSTAGIVEQKGFRFDWLMAATSAVERFRGFEADLGERFLDVRLGVDRVEAALKAVQTEIEGKCEVMRLEISEAVGKLIEDCKDNKVEAPDYAKRIAYLGDAAATLRSPVARDSKHQIVARPDPEVGARMAKTLVRLSKGMAMLRGKPKPDERDYLALLRVASDSIPAARMAVLRQVVTGVTEPNTIHLKTGLGGTKVSEQLEDLRLLGVIDGDNQLTPEWTKTLRTTHLDLALSRPEGTTVPSWAKLSSWAADNLEPCSQNPTGVL